LDFAGDDTNPKLDALGATNNTLGGDDSLDTAAGEMRSMYKAMECVMFAFLLHNAGQVLQC
jgi:hypothetical protein